MYCTSKGKVHLKLVHVYRKKNLYLPMSGNGSTISQFGTDLKNMATFCMAISVAWEIISWLSTCNSVVWHSLTYLPNK